MQIRAHPGARVGAFPENIAGALAYFSFLPAIVFLFVEPYRKNRFVRFHSIQCLLVWVTAILLALVIKLVGVVLLMIPVLGPLFVVLIDAVAILAAIFIWLVLVIKSLQGEMFKLLLLGEFAEQRSETGLGPDSG